MLDTFNKIRTMPTILHSSVALFLLGAANATFLPYNAIIATQNLGLSDNVFALIIMINSFAGLFGGVLMGAISDFVRDRKNLILLQVVVAVITFGGFFLLPHKYVFFVALPVAMTFLGASFSGLFALIRTVTEEKGSKEATAINSVVRAVFACAWILVPGLIGFYLSLDNNAISTWGITAGFLIIAGTYIYFKIPNTANPSPRSDDQSRLKKSLFVLLSSKPLLRISIIACITSMHLLSEILRPLIIIEELNGNFAHVGTAAAVVAFLEIIFMLLWGYLGKHLSNGIILSLGGFLFAIYLGGMGVITEIWQLFVLTIPAAAGAAVILTIPMSYLQDLFVGKPGLSASAMSVLIFVATLLNSTVYAMGPQFGDYRTTAIIGTGILLVGSIGILTFEKQRDLSKEPI